MTLPKNQGDGNSSQSKGSPSTAAAIPIDLFDNANFRPMNFKADYLNDKNYSLWRMKLLNVWKEFGVMAVAIGREERPVIPARTAEDYAKVMDDAAIWDRKDTRSSNFLLERITHSHIPTSSRMQKPARNNGRDSSSTSTRMPLSLPPTRSRRCLRMSGIHLRRLSRIIWLSFKPRSTIYASSVEPSPK